MSGGVSDATVWAVIVLLGIGTFLIRFSFLGVIGNRPMPPFVLRLLRYTAVAVMPGLAAPLVLGPEATGGALDPARLLAALATVAIGVVTRSMIWAMIGGAAVLYTALALLGQSA